MITNSNKESLFDQVRNMKGSLPNFYIEGNSLSALEKLGMQLTELIEQENLMSFRGIVKHFTINMPYFTDSSEIHPFLEHIRNSYSIAKDCYESFQGIILIELEETWQKHGYQSDFHNILRFIQEYTDVCFIFLVPEAKEDHRFYSDLIACGICMRIQLETPSAEQCVALFEQNAKDCGLQVSSDARKMLLDRLTEKDALATENIVVIERLWEQVLFERSMTPDAGKEIGTKELAFLSCSRKKTDTVKMGFTFNRQ